MGMVQFDAHRDVEQDSGGRIDHGSMFHYAVRDGILDPTRVVQVGIRTCFHGEETHGMTILHADRVHAMTAEEVAGVIRGVLGDGPSYLTFDIDLSGPVDRARHGDAGAGGDDIVSGAVDFTGDEGVGFQGDGCGRGVATL